MKKQTDACARCGKAKHRGRCKAAPAEPEPVTAVLEEPPADALNIPPGYGVRVYSQDGRLFIEQDGAEERVDTVVLTRHEAVSVLDWISKFAESPA